MHARASPILMVVCNNNGIYMVKRLTARKLLYSVDVNFDESTFPGLEILDSSYSGEID